jgi:hypothetical protein
MIQTCDVCGGNPIEDDGFMSCQVYIDGIELNSDEHTSINITGCEL